LLILSFKQERRVMGVIARIVAVSLLVGGLAAAIGYAFFGRYSDWSGISLFLGCAGGIIGAVAGAAREIVNAQRPRQARE
jgi:hypothetical protein